MKIERRDISSVQPYDRNPRINDGAVDAVAASLREFGFRQPVVVDAENVIIVGHARYKAAVKMGLPKIPVHVATDLTPEQVVAYRLADNKTGELSEWDFALLEAELEKIADIDMEMFGFGDSESEGGGPAEETEIKSVFQVVVECADEKEQREVFDILAGRKVRLVTL